LSNKLLVIVNAKVLIVVCYWAVLFLYVVTLQKVLLHVWTLTLFQFFLTFSKNSNNSACSSTNQSSYCSVSMNSSVSICCHITKGIITWTDTLSGISDVTLSIWTQLICDYNIADSKNCTIKSQTTYLKQEITKFCF